MKFVAPMPEQIGTLTMHFPKVSGGAYGPPEILEKCIVEVPFCSGMGATNPIFRAPTDFRSF